MACSFKVYQSNPLIIALVAISGTGTKSVPSFLVDTEICQSNNGDLTIEFRIAYYVANMEHNT
jgi:hypothetical protein